MSEMDELKKQAQLSKANQILKELEIYMDGLYKTLDKAYVNSMRNEALEMIALVTMLITVFSSIYSNQSWVLWASEALFYFMFFRSSIIMRPAIYETTREIRGCYRTLEILGYLTRDESNGQRKRMKNKISLVEQMWQAAKALKWKQAFAQRHI